jgi:hypothetical protein
MWLLLACAPAAEGLLPTPPGSGPEVTVDWDALPLPEIPWPNDLATRADPNSPTGLRLNLSTVATTVAEAEARAKLDELVGFGIYSPITVGFEAPLDLDAVLARHPDDFSSTDPFADDAVLLVDVDPDSPDFGRPVALDIGHGRFPADVPRTDRYFPNDPRSTIPSVLFDTTDEDLDGDGVLDPGEDTDFDGLLDIPNVWPPGGDPRADLLTWYERVTNTLILRPILPLREETTYAVVLTSALVGLDGQPVRSPWAWVNHTRQTSALLPALDALDALGRDPEEVAFAWAFTTGRVTGDLVDIRRGLDGEGPFHFLADDYPPGVVEAHVLHTLASTPPTWLPLDTVLNPFFSLGLFDDEGVDYLADAFGSFSDALVGGAFVTPDLLADRDDGGRDASDEWWQLDPVAGTLHAKPKRVAFTCLLPKEDPARGVVQPFPVVLHGHGYGSTRIEFVAFAHAMNRMGWAHCSMDFPGHGPGVSPDEALLVEVALGSAGAGPFWDHLLDARCVDLDNDGLPDSGGDQWSADAFHTRDMVRQAVVDWMALLGSLRACGTGKMDVVGLDAFGKRLVQGSLDACDFDEDGMPDIGGPGGRFAVDGGSLGGIVVGVAAGVIPGVEAWAPIVPGAGIVDVAVRTEIGGAVEAMHGRLMAPLFLGYPNGDGSVRIVQMVNSVMDMRELDVGTLPSVPPGGEVVVENLVNGEVRRAGIPDGGAFRVGIAADALDPTEKALEVGIPESGPELNTVYEVSDNAVLGDPLVLTVRDADGAEVLRIDTWPQDVLHEGITMRAGSRLVAASPGLGHIRATPVVRRLAGVLAAALEPGDPAAYAGHWFREPLPGMEPQRVLVMPTPGDTIVNINTGLAAARIAGILPFDRVDPRWGVTPDRWLIDRGVVQGLEEHGPFVGADGTPVLYDADDLDGGTDGTGAPTWNAMRLSVPVGDGLSALRLPYVSATGTHGFAVPDPSLAFDTPNFAIHQAALFLSSRGTNLSDDPCLARGDCSFLAPLVTAAP